MMHIDVESVGPNSEHVETHWVLNERSREILLLLLLLRLLRLLLPLLHDNVPQRLPRVQTQFKGFPTSTLDRDMVVKEFYGEKVVDKHCHKGEQVYWDKFSSIHNKWLKCSGLVPHTVENYKGVEQQLSTPPVGIGWAG